MIIATRKSELALKQAEMVKDFLKTCMPEVDCEILGLTTTGDEKKEMSLEKEGGKGLFTKEIEDAVLNGIADLAVHSTKDLPTKMPDGLVLAGFLKRDDVRDVLVLKEDKVSEFEVIATGSPRRRMQLQRMFSDVEYIGFRGNVGTRLAKIARGDADGTVLAAAGLDRLGIKEYEGLVFRRLEIEEMVPAVGQGAIAIQCRTEDAGQFSGLFDEETRYAVEIERIFLSQLGGGCQVAFAAYYNDGYFYVFHTNAGFRIFQIPLKLNNEEIKKSVMQIIEELQYDQGK